MKKERKRDERATGTFKNETDLSKGSTRLFSLEDWGLVCQNLQEQRMSRILAALSPWFFLVCNTTEGRLAYPINTLLFTPTRCCPQPSSMAFATAYDGLGFRQRLRS